MRRHHRVLAWTLASIAIAGWLPVAAHEGHQHNALGTVRAITAAELRLETREGTLETFTLTTATTYRRGDSTASHQDVTVGARAVVSYETRDGRNVAIDVRLAKADPPGNKQENAPAARNPRHRGHAT